MAEIAPTNPHRHQAPASPVEEILLEKMRTWTFISVEGVHSVGITPMPVHVHHVAKRLAARQRCFHNASRIATKLRDLDCRYVTGYARIGQDPVPFEHAWIKIGDQHFDPTWELFHELGKEYVPIYELTVEELIAVRRKCRDGKPPTPQFLKKMLYRK